ncbi:DNA-directed RNA polymerase sigma-70 factor [Flexivirga endophytica]|uniref:DNA-directed RNA polymerase sigma-70 factor n=1 Tax=Flexivirga endophytica TaxID=1849103 RepID=A0A916T5G5_9MICO|nr:DNA-directed RNA polymerase sigma-70 factor [Flexivirga endophytica]
MGMTFKSAAADAEFTRFVQQAAPSLLRTAWLLCGDEGRAEDLVQDALGKVYLKWGSVRAGRPAAYARRAIVNANTDRQRRRLPEILSSTAPDHSAETPSGLETIHSREVLLAALKKLPNRERQVVVLRYYVDLPEREVAEMLNVSLGSVKSSASRGLATLRASMSEKELRP